MGLWQASSFPGAGRPWAFIHGFTGTAADWHPVLAQMGGVGPALSMRLPGHHPEVSAAPYIGAASFERLVDDAAQSLAAWGAGPVHLVGYSLGARVALCLSLRHSSLVRRLTLVGCHLGLPDPAERALRKAADARWSRLLRHRGIAAFQQAWSAQPLFAPLRARRPDLDGRARAGRLQQDAIGLADAMDAFSLAVMPALWAPLKRSSLHVEFVAGGDDVKFAAIAHAAASSGLNASAVVVPGCGHNVMLEQPEALSSLLLSAR